ncbi:hypothetical protein HispidOSU_013397, partial [Sigmodon hispidus]
MTFVAESDCDSKLVPTGDLQSPSPQQLLAGAFWTGLTGARGERRDGGGPPEAPQHPPAAEDLTAVAPKPGAVETCRVCTGAWPRREAESARGPRLLGLPGPSRTSPLEAAQPPPRTSTLALPPRPSPVSHRSPTPARPLTPGERGPAAPSRACLFRLAQRRGLRGPNIAQ